MKTHADFDNDSDFVHYLADLFSVESIVISGLGFLYGYNDGLIDEIKPLSERWRSGELDEELGEDID